MNLTRRGFFGLLAGAVLDPERLLWVPGAKVISIPAPQVVDEIAMISIPRLVDIVFESSPLFYQVVRVAAGLR